MNTKLSRRYLTRIEWFLKRYTLLDKALTIFFLLVGFLSFNYGYRTGVILLILWLFFMYFKNTIITYLYNRQINKEFNINTKNKTQ
jgi:hypothetical protein